jgi:uncharacterized protein YihD (DUF1040 family)
MTKSKILGATLVLCAVFSVSVEAKLYKWVDDKGETHYGEVVPPEYANKDKVQFDEKGRVIKDKQSEENNNSEGKTAEQKAAFEQRRKDKALLNTYSNEKEIDLARDRNLQQVEARINSIQLLQQSAQESLKGFRKEASTITAGKQIPASLQADITAAENRIARLKQDLDEANAKAVSVKASFEADKVRYRELIGGSKK